MKRIISLLLALVMIMSTFAFTFSVNAEDVAPAAEENQIVARMYIWVRIVVFGHSGIYIENKTDHDITVGCYTCPAYQGVTVSATNTSRKDGKGNYYNIDSYCLNKYGSSNMTWAGVDLTQEMLDKVSAAILSRNTWQAINNCDYFSSMVWNSVAPNKIKHSPSPVVFKGYIKKNPLHCSGPKFYVADKDQCFKQIGTNSNAYLKPCSEKSYKGRVG